MQSLKSNLIFKAFFLISDEKIMKLIKEQKQELKNVKA